MTVRAIPDDHPMFQDDFIRRARAFAVKHHGAQTRKDGTTPYWTHLDGVALMLWETCGVRNRYTLAGGFNHDILEDTEVTEEQLEAELGKQVLAIVLDCTRDPEVGRIAYSSNFRRALPEACLIKLCDRTYNLEDWGGMDAGYLKPYSSEGMEVVTHILRNKKTKRWTADEKAGATHLMRRLTNIFLTHNSDLMPFLHVEAMEGYQLPVNVPGSGIFDVVLNSRTGHIVTEGIRITVVPVKCVKCGTTEEQAKQAVEVVAKT